MRKLLIAAALMLPMMLCCSSSGSGENAGSGEKTVYICTGKSAKKYHKSPRCKGLRSCKGDIVEVELSRAEAMGKTPCRICY